MKVKMRQYNLFFKLAELFTVTIEGTLQKPTYILEKQKNNVRSWEPEARSQKPEARSQKPEARSQKPEARSQRFFLLTNISYF